VEDWGENDTEDAIAWRVLLVAPDLHERPVVLIEREDAAFLETTMPDPLKSARDGAETARWGPALAMRA
jgi:hypothetical protein